MNISISDDQLADLRSRLQNTRWAPALKDQTGRGMSVTDLKEAVDYWLNAFDWKAVEREINAGPNHTTRIDGAEIHFQHHRSPHPEAVPILLTHGWPGAFTEFKYLIPRLIDPTAFGGSAQDAFHVVVPSLPGYTLSAPLHETGWDVMRIAAAWKELMAQLGYSKYVAQGGDAGSPISSVLSMIDSEHVMGIHLNMVMAFPTSADDPAALSETDSSRLEQVQQFLATQGSYMQVMATEPLTLAHGLSDSPAGLLGWMLPRFRDWADPSNPIALDDILTIASLYWFTNTIASSSNFYFEGAPAVQATLAGEPVPPVPVPTGVSVFPHETFIPIRSLAQRGLPNIVLWSEHDRGGHFAALEQPDLLARDLWAFKNLILQETQASPPVPLKVTS